MVELARAFLFDPRILVLDEISPRLTSNELDTIFQMLSLRRQQGKAIIYIANNLDEVMQIADRVTVLKDGRRKGTEPVRTMDRLRILTLTNNKIFNLNEDEKAENVLSLIELFNEALINDLPLGIITLTPAFQVSMMNWAARRILDVHERETRGRDLTDALSSTSIANASDIAARIRNHERRSWNNLRLGKEKYINLKTFPLQNENSISMGSILMFEDVSMNHFVKEYLLRAEKITSVAELAAGGCPRNQQPARDHQELHRAPARHEPRGRGEGERSQDRKGAGPDRGDDWELALLLPLPAEPHPKRRDGKPHRRNRAPPRALDSRQGRHLHLHPWRGKNLRPRGREQAQAAPHQPDHEQHRGGVSRRDNRRQRRERRRQWRGCHHGDRQRFRDPSRAGHGRFRSVLHHQDEQEEHRSRALHLPEYRGKPWRNDNLRERTRPGAPLSSCACRCPEPLGLSLSPRPPRSRG